MDSLDDEPYSLCSDASMLSRLFEELVVEVAEAEPSPVVVAEDGVFDDEAFDVVVAAFSGSFTAAPLIV